MMRFTLKTKPINFLEEVERPGKAWLLANPTGRPKDLWSPFRPQLASAFENLCAYSAMIDLVGTVDHFVSCNEDRNQAYDWANYRYSSGWLNSSKTRLRAAQILDPFQVENDWFEILLPSLQLVLTDRLPHGIKPVAEFVLKRLHLQDDERVIRQRRAWYEMYQNSKISLSGLADVAPLIARAVEKANANIGGSSLETTSSERLFDEGKNSHGDH